MANSTVNKSNGFQSPRRMLAAAAMSTLASSAASAAPIYWGAAGVTNLWATSSNWYTDAAETAVSGSVPVSTSDVYFNTTPDNALGGTITVGTDIFANSLTFNTSATTTLSQSGNRVLSLGTGGITANSGAATIGVSTNSLSVQLTGSQTWTNNSSNTLNVRTFRASNSATGPVELTLNAAGAGAITFNLSAQDSPDATKALSIVIDSAGANSVNMVASGYTGGTTVKRGFLNTSGTLGTGSIALGLAGGTNDLRLNATGAVANNITVASGTGLRALTGSGSGDFQGNITLNRDVSIGSVSSSGQTLAVSGNISGNASITVGRIAGGTSNPTVTLTGDSTFTGKTIVESAVLVVDSLNSVSGGSSSSALGAPTTVANGTISLSAVSSSTLRYIGTGETTDRVIDMAGATNGVTLEQAGTGHLKFTSNLTSTGNGAKTLTLRGATAGTAEISGNIPNSTGSIALNKSDSGTWRLSGEGSTYAGITTVAGGVLEIIKIANINSPSSIGAPTIAVGPTVLNGGGTLRYIGAGDSTNRVLTLGSGLGGVLDASGAGALVFSNSTSSAFGSPNNASTLTLTGTSEHDNTYAANQKNNGTGALTLIKSGSGTWVLSGDSVYTGPTSVDAGLLKITGSLGHNAVSVNNTGTLGGTGTIAGSVTVNTGGTLAPGNSLGVLGTGELTLAGGSVLSIEANGTTVSTQYDQVNVTGGVSIAGNLAVALGYTPTLGDNLFIINNDGSDAVGGGFANLGVGNTVDLAFNSVVYRFAVSYTGDFGSRSTTGGNDVVLTNVLVPEPSTLALIAFSALGLTRRRRDA